MRREGDDKGSHGTDMRSHHEALPWILYIFPSREEKLHSNQYTLHPCTHTHHDRTFLKTAHPRGPSQTTQHWAGPLKYG